MSILSDIHDSALELLEDLTGNQTCTINGVRYPCIPSTLRRGTIIVVGGREEEIQGSVTIRKSLFDRFTADMDRMTVDSTFFTADQTAQKPGRSGQRLTKDEREYRILSRSESPDGSHYRFDLGAVYK